MHFLYTIEFWTAAATLVALFVPLYILWFTNQPKKSKINVKGVSIVNQDPASDEAEKQTRRLLNVGRIILKNEGKYIASSVEAYIEKIIFMGQEREDFFPVPLFWTHGQLNKNGPTIRDIYPNQVVYLDLFNHIYDDEYINDNVVVFAVAAGLGVDQLSKMNLGTSELTIKLYQESGQVVTLLVEAKWDQKGAPSLRLL